MEDLVKFGSFDLPHRLDIRAILKFDVGEYLLIIAGVAEIVLSDSLDVFPDWEAHQFAPLLADNPRNTRLNPIIMTLLLAFFRLNLLLIRYIQQE